MGFKDRLSHAWNAFVDKTTDIGVPEWSFGGGASYGSSRPDRVRLFVSNERSIISAVYTRIAIDAASVVFRHVKLDENKRYSETVNSGLNTCLTLETNVDQTAEAFFRDIYTRLFDRGVIAIVPVDTTVTPSDNGGYGIDTMRVGEIIQWYPRHVKVKLWNDVQGRHEEIVVSKEVAAIVENPFYNIMNETNSTYQRLVRKLNLLDSVDEQSSSGKLDLIIQLPYVVRNESRKQQAQARRKDIEEQLNGSKYGIAYTDGTERITQLNRPAENNMMKQVEYLTKMLYSQLGITESIMDGTADEKTMLNYRNRTIVPVVKAVQQSMLRTFLTKTARTQGHSVEYFIDPFELVPVSSLAEIADKFTRNEILTSNEVRGLIGFKPSTDSRADELVNKNLPTPEEKPDNQGHMTATPGRLAITQ